MALLMAQLWRNYFIEEKVLISTVYELIRMFSQDAGFIFLVFLFVSLIYSKALRVNNWKYGIMKIGSFKMIKHYTS